MIQMDRDEVSEYKKNLGTQFESKIRFGQDFICHLILDDDECKWPLNSDPNMDIIFGKGGIPTLAWYGQNIFNNTEKLTPSIVFDAVNAHLEQSPDEQERPPSQLS